MQKSDIVIDILSEAFVTTLAAEMAVEIMFSQFGKALARRDQAETLGSDRTATRSRALQHLCYTRSSNTTTAPIRIGFESPVQWHHANSILA